MPVILIGGGGHCMSCCDVINSTGKEIAGYLSPEISKTSKKYTWLGTDEWFTQALSCQYEYLVAVGQTQISPIRKNLFDKIKNLNLTLYTAISNYAVVSTSTQIGTGSVVMHKAVINAGAEVGKNCIINTAAIIEHDVIVKDHVHVSTGAIINGDVSIGEGSMIGSGAVVLPGISIADNCMVGAGALVTKSLSAGTWVGVPATRIK